MAWLIAAIRISENQNIFSYGLDSPNHTRSSPSGAILVGVFRHRLDNTHVTDAASEFSFQAQARLRPKVVLGSHGKVSRHRPQAAHQTSLFLVRALLDTQFGSPIGEKPNSLRMLCPWDDRMKRAS
jgi:hypothetical protein